MLKQTPPARLGALPLLEALGYLKDEDPEMQLQRVLTLLYIAAHPNCTGVEIGKHVGIVAASVSRNAADLSTGRAGRKGLKLIHRAENPLNRVENIHHLTPAGERLVDKLIRELEAGYGSASTR